MHKKYLITGGTGFIGAALTRRLVKDGYTVRVLDNGSRGSAARLSDIAADFEYIEADIRDPRAVERAVEGMDGVFHLACINGTEFFYTKPDEVLDVGVKGIVNVIDACLKYNVGELTLASSSEVYQTPPTYPTAEDVPLVIPDPMNPRYSYGACKIISEQMLINFGRKYFDRALIFRPHNVYGPDMGWEHVLPQFIVRMKRICDERSDQRIPFPIQGDGSEARAFVYIDDFIDGVMTMCNHGDHLGIYHVGSEEEASISNVVKLVGDYFDRHVDIIPGKLQVGGTDRRCPDIGKLRALGYNPKISLSDGLPLLAKFYVENAHLAPSS